MPLTVKSPPIVALPDTDKLVAVTTPVTVAPKGKSGAPVSSLSTIVSTIVSTCIFDIFLLFYKYL